MRYEYLCANFYEGSAGLLALNALGGQGWRMVCLLGDVRSDEGGPYRVGYFVRELPDLTSAVPRNVQPKKK